MCFTLRLERVHQFQWHTEPNNGAKTRMMNSKEDLFRIAENYKSKIKKKKMRTRKKIAVRRQKWKT
jgi:hypothetical protein